KKVAKEQLHPGDIVPGEIMNVPTDVVQVGKLTAFAFDKKARHRPCPMGTSGGHYQITAGTNGELLRDKKAGKTCIGTNNHVGANSNDAQIGDPYLQPAPSDGGSVGNDKIGNLLRFIPLSFGDEPSSCPFAALWSGISNAIARGMGSRTRLKPVIPLAAYNVVDAAMIEVDASDVTSEIVGIGVPKGVRQANLNMKVQKSGRTSCHTTDGDITGVDATIGPVGYGYGKSAYFKDQIVITKQGFSSGGDSGSLVLDMDGYAVGKLFAGNSSEGITLANSIQHYLTLLDAELITT
ncbi:MAG: hypothetical protein KAI64_06745, partial [Thermoplasmata archaeon]|nr:hypothetical protein [Thermoplasmata archaeon]